MTRETAPRGRKARKGRTRQALMDAALDLVAKKAPFSSLSLREVTKKAGVVPTAFYRHFTDMSALGLTLLDESFRTLRQMMREVRQHQLPNEQMIRGSMETYFNYVRNNRTYFLFVSKELYGGSATMRQAIRREIRLFVSELAMDMARFPFLINVSSQDLQMMATLVVNSVVALTQEMLELSEDDEAGQNEMLIMAEKQVRLIYFGVAQWRSEPDRIA
ncbi:MULTISPECIES: TetR family transcriptional regulator [Alcanivoracaceae]|jgi:AcrR family transcriptional regulator|uniref:TetR family transcriptional regulator n=3 Tax=Alcanivoracaceae TaxID=224372 RepID=A0A9Q3W9T2_9GAMM|nr:MULTISPECIES: TetR family transcriptional regulator [Alcanivoracaceae]KYZ87228.1 TetR family transcriptional regulator [Alcanivorax sp. KX64203]MBA4722869.1 TetR family transcriptional regulator [Alcanivorax sp.]ARB45162.1 TetR family transcriptional regulator [Alloalcanivorax xenomutans]MCE7510908.1 TetR family transcriptional regulator [Alloalcanivorax xenomutans]MCE7522495.1 TetR family transcriptional regulator [Alloalcanivorax xenomutans]